MIKDSLGKYSRPIPFACNLLGIIVIDKLMKNKLLSDFDLVTEWVAVRSLKQPPERDLVTGVPRRHLLGSAVDIG